MIPGGETDTQFFWGEGLCCVLPREGLSCVSWQSIWEVLVTGGTLMGPSPGLVNCQGLAQTRPVGQHSLPCGTQYFFTDLEFST